MDEISMRVAALKFCSHDKEFSKMRENPILLPNKWITSQTNFVFTFASARSSVEQVAAVKTIFHTCRDVTTAAEFLSDLLFACPLKHALRNQLTKLFSDKAVLNQTAVGHTKQSLLQALVLSLRRIADTIEENPSGGNNSLNDMFVSINACLQNFPYGREALKQEIQRFFPLLPKTLNGYLDAIRNMGHFVSPTCRNRYFLFVQNILRFHVAVMSEWNTQLLIMDPEPVRQLQILAYKVARDRDTPWDVRSIAGLTIGHNARFLHEFDIYLKNCCNLLDLNELPIQAAALLVLQAEEYATLAKNALSILQRILAVATSDENFSSILVFLSKNLLIYSKSLSKVIELHDPALNFFKLIICALQEFSVYHICSNIDSVRHICSALLRQVLQLALSLNLEKAFKYIYALFERQQMPLNSRCLILEQLVFVLDVKLVIGNCPSLFKMVFPNYLGHEDCVDSLFKIMMTNAFSNQSFIDWHNMWCDMLITTAKACDERLPAVERIIMHSANLSQEFLDLVLRETVPLSTKLAVMLTIRQVPLRREVQILYKQQLNEALVGLDDHTRILALRFVVDMPRPSKCFGSDELDAIMFYLQHNANNPSAHIRQLGFGLFKKALQRIELNLGQHMKRPISGGEELLQFFTKFMAKLSYNLFPTANYGRRWISLRLLHLCVQMCCRQDIPFIEKLPNVTVPYLEHCLSDSYEHNKTHASHLLCIVSKKSRLRPVQIMEMLLSLRPPDSSTGAYQLQVYCQSVEVEEELPLLIDTTVYEPRTYKALMWCYKHLRKGTFFAQQDLAEAAKMNPLYGLLCASRHLIMQLNMDKLAEEKKWRQYIYELLDLCMTIIKVVLPIVSSSSPEGYLPASRDNKIKDMENANVLRRRLGAKTVQQLPTTPQMVLLCGWRSVKEIALILGELVQRAPLEQENPDSFLLEKSQLSAIGDNFLMLLAETKHRGAFEQAYVGFTMLCRRFWLSDEVSLNQQPNLWVQEAMLMIEGSNKNLCLTRRSAGMPFMLQALICTELKLGTHGTLYKTIFLLLNICERRTSSKESVVSRSHALNTLRALYRCSELSDFVGEYVSRGVICALGCLLADEWSERNSATLTLAAIIVRIFGVERARSYKGDFHLRNRMTGRVFFTRYPELFDFFYIGLKHAAVKINDQSSGNRSTEQTIQLEAMLLILCRLYPSSSEGSESSLNLIEFVPFLKSITKSHDLVTRQRASQIIANFVSPHRSVDLIRKIIFHLIVLEQQLRGNLSPTKNGYSRLRLDWNYLHGQVLQLHHLYKVIRWTYPSLSRLVVHTLSQLAIQVCHCDIFLFIAIIDVLVTIMEDICDLNQINPKVMDVVFAVYRLNHAWIYKRCEKNSTSPRSFAVFALHLNRLIFKKKGILQYMIDFMEQENLPPDVEQLQIDLWLYVMFQNNKNTSKSNSPNGLIDNFDIDFYRINGDVAKYYDSLKTQLREEVTEIILLSKRIYISILKMRDNIVMGKYFSPKRACRIYALLGLLPNQTLTLDEILDHCLIDDEIQPGLVLSVSRLISECGVEQHQWMPVLSYILRIANPSQTKYMRRKASQLCDRLTKCISLQLSLGDVEIIGHYCRLVIILLTDESDSVRNFMAQMVNINIVNKNKIFLANFEILPSLAMPKFLNHILINLQKHSFSCLLRLYKIIIEPFVKCSQIQQKRELSTLSEEYTELDEEFELFEKQEINLYCEEVYIVSMVTRCFETVFCNNERLIKAIHDSDTFISFDIFDKDINHVLKSRLTCDFNL